MLGNMEMAGRWTRWAAHGMALLFGELSLEAQVVAGPFVSPVNSHVYFLLAESSWQDAESLAVSLGGHLATVRTAEEQAWVFDQFGSWGGPYRSLWIGLRRVSPDGNWGWVSGEPITYTHWLPGQPDNSPVTQGEDYVHMLNTANSFGHPGGYWNDLASPNLAFGTFNPLCGVVEVVPPKENDVRLKLVSDLEGWRFEASVPATTVRVVWEVSTNVMPSWWSVVDVQSAPSGQASWRRPTHLSGNATFHRVRVYDTPGFNARLDQVVRSVRKSHPEAALLESYPVLSITGIAMPDSAVLRSVFRVSGGTVMAEQANPSSDPSIDFNPTPWMGDMDLPWPVAMNLEEAESAMRNEGFGAEYRTVALRQPLKPGMDEPYFIFGTPSFGFVFVGTITRKVFVGK